MKSMTCFKVSIEYQEMDMSGGDNVDGPRWTGGWIKTNIRRMVVAPNAALASAAAMHEFYDHEKATVKTVKKLFFIDSIVNVARSEEVV